MNGFVHAGLIERPDINRGDDPPTAGTSACAEPEEATDSESEHELDAAILDLFISDTDASDFEGFCSEVEEEEEDSTSR